MVEQAGGVIENDAVELAVRDDDLEGVAKGVVAGYHVGDYITEGSPEELIDLVSRCNGRVGGFLVFKRLRYIGRQLGQARKSERTAVIVSMQRTNASCVRYRESERAYSFQS